MKSLSCWVVTEGLAGTENQCLGVCEQLGIKPEIKRIELRQPWKSFSPLIGLENKKTFTAPLEPPWPDLLLTAGRKSVAAARYIKKASKGRTFSVHLQDPRTDPGTFDLVAVPEHDPTRGANVLVTKAAANRITNKKLENAREESPQFSQIKQPRVAVLIGGTSKAYTMTPDVMTDLCRKLQKLDAGLMVTTSRRTGMDNEKILKQSLKNTEAWIWDQRGENPYFALLGWADYILVTADSVSMLSESCTTGKPVYMIPMPGGGRRLNALQHNLMEHGALRVFEGALEQWDYEPLNDAEKIASEIKKRLKEKGITGSRLD